MVASTVVLVSPDRVFFSASNYVAPKGGTCGLNHIQPLSAHPLCTTMLNLQVVNLLGTMPALTFSQLRCFTEWLVPQAAQVYTARTVADFLLKLLKDGRTPSTIEGYRAAIADSYPDVGLSLLSLPILDLS